MTEENLLLRTNNKSEEIKTYTASTATIKQLNTFRTKLQTKYQTSVTESNFFNKNTVCPTCTQNIEETFRVNKIDHLQEVISKYETNLSEIEQAITKEEERERKFGNNLRKTELPTCFFKKTLSDSQQWIL